MATTEVENLLCPECGALVKQTIRQQGFRAGGTCIGPAVVPCPACGVLVATGDSEWIEKSILHKSWFVLCRLVWMIVGSIFIGALFGVVAGWIGVEFGFIAEAERITWNLFGYGIATVLICAILVRNALWEIRESHKRTLVAVGDRRKHSSVTGGVNTTIHRICNPK